MSISFQEEERIREGKGLKLGKGVIINKQQEHSRGEGGDNKGAPNVSMSVWFQNHRQDKK